MILDYVMKNINQNFQDRITPTSLTSRPLLSKQVSQKDLKKTTPFTEEIIKEKLPGVIRKRRDIAFVINETQPKSPSPFSKSKLKVILESKQNSIKSVVKKSPANPGMKSAKSSVSELLSAKNSQICSVLSQYSDEKENNIIEIFRERRKQEKESEQSQRLQKKLFKKQM